MQSAREEIRDLERVRYVTENYELLQGLKLLPVGVLMLTISALTLLRLDLPGMTHEEESTLFGVLLILGGMFGILAASLMSWVIGGHYERLYGKTRRLPVDLRVGTLIMIGVVTFYAAFMVDGVLRTSVYLIYLVVGAAGIMFWWPERRFRIHYLLVAATFLVIGFLPLTGLLPENYAEALGFISFHLGASAIVIGLLDHLLLTRTMKALPKESNG